MNPERPGSRAAKPLRYQLISLQEFYDLSFSLAQVITASGFQPDIVIAIARGGFPPARFLCDFLNVKAMTSITLRHYTAAGASNPQASILYPLAADIANQNVLLVDDVNDTGETLQLARDYLVGLGPQELKTAVLHEKMNSIFRVDFMAESVSEWRWIIYPWAAVEDVGGVILAEYSDIDDQEQLRTRLLAEHGIDAPVDLLARIKAIHAALG